MPCDTPPVAEAPASWSPSSFGWPGDWVKAGGDLDLARGTFMFYVQGSPPWEALGREGFKSTVEGLK